MAIGSVDELYRQLNEKMIGRVVHLDVLRNGRKTVLTVIPGEQR
jgi:S1-C subfamily serine protease